MSRDSRPIFSKPPSGSKRDCQTVVTETGVRDAQGELTGTKAREATDALGFYVEPMKPPFVAFADRPLRHSGGKYSGGQRLFDLRCRLCGRWRSPVLASAVGRRCSEPKAGRHWRFN